jgi:hypothetical protein
MKTILLMLVLMCSTLFAQMTMYTEGRHYSTVSADGEITSTGFSEDRSKWYFGESGKYFIHNTSSGMVSESTYWIEDGSIEDEDDGITCIATSDAGNTRRFYFLEDAVIIILNSYDDGSKDIVTFIVKNITKF